MPHRYKEVIFPLITIIISVIVSVSIIEFTFRISGYSPRPIRNRLHPHFSSGNTWAKKDPELGWVNRYGKFRSIEPGKNIMSFNRDGSRTIPSDRRNKTTEELLIVGGSFAQGYGVKDQDTFSFIIDNSQEKFRVRNFGTAAYSTYQSLLTMKRHINPNTRAVIYGYLSPHRNRNVSDIGLVMGNTDTSGNNIVAPHVRLKENGQLQYHEYRRIRPWPLEQHSAIVTLAHKVQMKMIYRSDEAERDAVTYKLLIDMKEYAAINGVEFYLVLLLTVKNDMVPSIVKSEGMNVIDCRSHDYFRRRELRLGSSIMTHASALQHEIWATCILDSVTR